MKGVVAIGLIGVLAACGERAPSLPVARALSPESAKHSGASWSPDGKRIAYWQPVADSSLQVQLWVANADGSSPVMLPVRGNGNGGIPVPATWSPDGSKLAAVTSEFGAAGVVVVPAAGGVPKRITAGPGLSFNGSWNRDGDRIEILQSADGGTFRTAAVSLSKGTTVSLVPHETHPFVARYSPDGAHVLYQEVDGPRSTLWVADSVGEHPRQLTTEGFESIQWWGSSQPWSPDSKEILYESRRTGTSDLWVVPIDGGKPRQLTHDVRNDFNGNWSPDGKWVAFVSDRGRQLDVWVVSATGDQEMRVTDTPAEETEPPRFRPGTSDLLFVESTSRGAIWSTDVADGKETRLTPDSVRTSFFNVSPDGKQFDFVIERGGATEDLAIAPISGGSFRTLTSGGGTVVGPYWSPSGSKIAFASDRAGLGDIFVVDAAGGPLKQLEDWPGQEGSPAWAKDDSWIYFLSDRDARIQDVWKVSPNGGAPVRVTKGAVVNNVYASRGVEGVYVNTFGRNGVFPTSRVRPDGSLQTIWDKSNSFVQSVSPSGDSVVIVADQQDGKTVSMLIPAKGGQGRVLLPFYEVAGNFSYDGKSLIYTFRSGGADHLGILTLASGAKRPLTHGGDRDAGAEWTPDGSKLVFSRYHEESRIFIADLTKALAAPK